MSIRKEVKIGIYFVLSLIALYWGVNFLKGRDVFGKVNTLYTEYEDVEGLQSTSQVFMKGLKIGTVKSIKFNENESRFIVELQIKSNYNIPNNSVAHLYSADIMSNKAIRIAVGDSPDFFKDKDKIGSAVDSDITTMLKDELLPLKEKVEKLVDELNTTFKSVNNVLDERTTKNISNGVAHLSGTLANIEKITEGLNNGKGSILNSLKNVESVTANLKDNNAKINKILDNTTAFTDSLRTLNLNRTLNEVHDLISQINSDKGTIGKLLHNDELYTNLNSSLTNLDLLLEDFRLNPRRYVNVSVFGRKQKEYVPPVKK